MKENIRTIVLDCLSLTVIGLFLLSEICEGQTIKWKGTIEIENGVRIIKNPNEPVYGDAVFNLEEELCIGSEDDKNYAFYKGVGILVDQEENSEIGWFDLNKLPKIGWQGHRKLLKKLGGFC